MPPQANTKGSFSKITHWEPKLAHIHRGYTEAASGQPFNQKFMDSLSSPSLARNYERGRLYAVQLLAHGFTPPTWRWGTMMPQRAKDLIRATFSLCGDPNPNGIVPEDSFKPRPHTYTKPPKATLAELGL